MENANGTAEDQMVKEIYQFTANAIVHEKRSHEDTISLLMDKGLDRETAGVVVDNTVKFVDDAKKKRAQKDMLYGALWCVGGTIATLAQVGFIFWGAIVFGAIQFFRGVANSR